MKAVLRVIVVLVFLSSGAYATDLKNLKVGDKFHYSIVGEFIGDKWVNIKNLQGIAPFHFGDACRIVEGDMEMIGFEKKETLMRWTPSYKTEGNMCPDKAIFFFSNNDLKRIIKLNEEERKRKISEEKLANAIKEKNEADKKVVERMLEAEKKVKEKASPVHAPGYYWKN
jgi:hypothetical protein